MKNELINWEQAVALRDLGFDEPTLFCYRNEYGLYSHSIGGYIEDMDFRSNSDLNGYQINETKIYWLSCPTYSQAFRWFREKYKLHQYIKQYSGENFFFNIEDMAHPRRFEEYTIEMLRAFNESSLQEEAESKCLDKLIEIIKKINQK